MKLNVIALICWILAGIFTGLSYKDTGVISPITYWATYVCVLLWFLTDVIDKNRKNRL